MAPHEPGEPGPALDVLDNALQDFRYHYDALSANPEVQHPNLQPEALTFLEARPSWLKPRDITNIEDYESRYELAKEIADKLSEMTMEN